MPYKNIEDRREASRRWRRNNPEKYVQHYMIQNSSATGKLRRWKYHLKNLGWSLETYQKQYKLQKGLCAVCKCHFDDLRPDHNHKTGKARELLCYCCNTGLGLFQDNPKLLKYAAAYLERHNHG